MRKKGFKRVSEGLILWPSLPVIVLYCRKRADPQSMLAVRALLLSFSILELLTMVRVIADKWCGFWRQQDSMRKAGGGRHWVEGGEERPWKGWDWWQHSPPHPSTKLRAETGVAPFQGSPLSSGKGTNIPFSPQWLPLFPQETGGSHFGTAAPTGAWHHRIRLWNSCTNPTYVY